MGERGLGVKLTGTQTDRLVTYAGGGGGEKTGKKKEGKTDAREKKFKWGTGGHDKWKKENPRSKKNKRKRVGGGGGGGQAGKGWSSNDCAILQTGGYARGKKKHGTNRHTGPREGKERTHTNPRILVAPKAGLTQNPQNLRKGGGGGT